MMLVVDSEVDPILAVLGPGIQAILGPDLIGLYLDGSLALGDFDSASDIDFVAVCSATITAEQLADLQALHDRVAALPGRLALEIEGFYVPPAALNRPGPTPVVCPNLERGPGERLKPVTLEAGWVVHRWILREHGITLVGPTPKTLVDPVTADDLRGAMRALQDGWRVWLAGGGDLRQIGFLSYAVLSQCRLLYTLEHGSVVSKAVAAAWALDRLPPTWRPVIAAARETRLGPGRASAPEEIAAAQRFMAYAASQ
ncbi:MAG TPA: DUF4111 domain-containing protein [Anaerolineales bacterium]|nr:DUF4111 domain-containing protein [Anaerolineales bacterium]